jgi:hypothetical protein
MASKISLKEAFPFYEDKLAFEHKLIMLVEPHRHIWDTKDLDYRTKIKRQNTFSKIGEEMGKEGEL